MSGFIQGFQSVFKKDSLVPTVLKVASITNIILCTVTQYNHSAELGSSTKIFNFAIRDDVLSALTINLAVHIMFNIASESIKELKKTDSNNTNKICSYAAYAMVLSFGMGFVSAKLEMKFTQSILMSCFALSIFDELGKDLKLIDKERYTISNAACDSIKDMCYKDGLEVCIHNARCFYSIVGS